MHTITIGVASASASINITPAPAFAVNTTASGSNSSTFVPNPINPGLIDVLGSQFTPEVNTQVVYSGVLVLVALYLICKSYLYSPGSKIM